MGTTASKPARSAVSAVSRRQYPKTASPSTTKPKTTNPVKQPASTESISNDGNAAGPTYHSNEPASSLRSQAIDLDARDPHFAASLRSIGPVRPNPTFSHSSTFHQSPFSSPQVPQSSDQSQSQSQSSRSSQSSSAGTASGTRTDTAVVTPSPSVFPDANTNPALLVLSARSRIARAAERELEAFGRPSHPGREYLDATTIRQVLSMRDRQGLRDGEIEQMLRLKRGVVGRLGEKGMVSEAV